MICLEWVSMKSSSDLSLFEYKGHNFDSHQNKLTSGIYLGLCQVKQTLIILPLCTIQQNHAIKAECLLWKEMMCLQQYYNEHCLNHWPASVLPPPPSLIFCQMMETIWLHMQPLIGLSLVVLEALKLYLRPLPKWYCAFVFNVSLLYPTFWERFYGMTLLVWINLVGESFSVELLSSKKF